MLVDPIGKLVKNARKEHKFFLIVQLMCLSYMFFLLCIINLYFLCLVIFFILMGCWFVRRWYRFSDYRVTKLVGYPAMKEYLSEQYAEDKDYAKILYKYRLLYYFFFMRPSSVCRMEYLCKKYENEGIKYG